MALTAAQRDAARSEVVKAVFGQTPATVTKTEIDTAVAACVTWIEANAASALVAMGTTVLAAAPAPVQAAVLSIAIAKRYGG